MLFMHTQISQTSAPTEILFYSHWNVQEASISEGNEGPARTQNVRATKACFEAGVWRWQDSRTSSYVHRNLALQTLSLHLRKAGWRVVSELRPGVMHKPVWRNARGWQNVARKCQRQQAVTIRHPVHRDAKAVPALVAVVEDAHP